MTMMRCRDDARYVFMIHAALMPVSGLYTWTSRQRCPARTPGGNSSQRGPGRPTEAPPPPPADDERAIAAANRPRAGGRAWERAPGRRRSAPGIDRFQNDRTTDRPAGFARPSRRGGRTGGRPSSVAAAAGFSRPPAVWLAVSDVILSRETSRERARCRRGELRPSAGTDLRLPRGESARTRRRRQTTPNLRDQNRDRDRGREWHAYRVPIYEIAYNLS